MTPTANRPTSQREGPGRRAVVPGTLSSPVFLELLPLRPLPLPLVLFLLLVLPLPHSGAF